MPLGSEYVVAYDAGELGSTKHLLKRNGQHVAVCGDPLQPYGRIRYLENEESRGVYSEADCKECLWQHALALGRMIGLNGDIPADYRDAIAALPESDFDGRVVLALRYVLRHSSFSKDALLREHFPAGIVERAAA
jgi:hypothetical protein